MPQIISASRRTDIPAYFSQWLAQRLAAGHCDWRQPFSGKWLRVSLLPRDVAGIVLWTKNPGPLIPYLDDIRSRYVFYVQFTITGHGPPLEPNVISPEEAVGLARELAARYGSGALVWRFDPIVFIPGSGPEETVSRFERLAGQLEGCTETCVISFMSPYRRQEKAFTQLGLEHQEPSAEQRRELVARLAATASRHGMALTACCNADIVCEAVDAAHCVDAARLRQLGANLPDRVPVVASRDGCGCAKSVDIGAYDLCAGGCAYCYANQNPELGARNRTRHDPDHQALAEACFTRPAP